MTAQMFLQALLVNLLTTKRLIDQNPFPAPACFPKTQNARLARQAYVSLFAACRSEPLQAL
jgi:hypothetical protein